VMACVDAPLSLRGGGRIGVKRSGRRRKRVAVLSVLTQERGLRRGTGLSARHVLALE